MGDLALRLKALEVGLWDYEIEADILSCDARWYALLGVSPGSVRRIADFRPHIHPEDVAMATEVDLDKIDALIAHDARYHVDFRVIRPDGVTRWWRSVACLLVDPASGHRRASGCVTDITEFRRIDSEVTGGAEVRQRGEAPFQETDGGASPALSARELECLRWVGMGKTAWETAVITGLSRRTIEFHLRNAIRKLSAINKVHASVIAVRRGLI